MGRADISLSSVVLFWGFLILVPCISELARGLFVPCVTKLSGSAWGSNEVELRLAGQCWVCRQGPTGAVFPWVLGQLCPLPIIDIGTWQGLPVAAVAKEVALAASQQDDCRN